MLKIKINNKLISNNNRTYFIADIAANHDGSLALAKKLIKLCAESGADAAKFQHFKAETIVSDKGFKQLGKFSHQKKWKKSIFEVYKKASLNQKWNKVLKKTCKKYKIDFLTSPYDLSYVDEVNKFIAAYKIGSGDLTWSEIVEKIAKKRKLVLLATGASTLNEVKEAVKTILKKNKKLVLMQCNTNYTADKDNFRYINLNVLKQYKKIFKNKIIYGLSDHTFGSETVLGAISLGARVIEKHFTDDNERDGPDHQFSMNPATWKSMILSARKLEEALGNGLKKIEKNEKLTSIIQRRAIRAAKNIPKGTIIKREHLVVLRPCPKDGILPNKLNKVLGKKTKENLKYHDYLSWKKIK